MTSSWFSSTSGVPPREKNLLENRRVTHDAYRDISRLCVEVLSNLQKKILLEKAESVAECFTLKSQAKNIGPRKSKRLRVKKVLANLKKK